MRKAPSLAARIAWLGIGCTLVVALLGGWIVRERVHDTVNRSVQENLSQRAERVLARFIATSDGVVAEDGARAADEFNQIFSGWYWQLESGGRVLRSRSLWDGGLELAPRPPGAGGLISARGPRGEALVGIERQVRIGATPARLLLFGAAADADREMAQLDSLLLAAQSLLVFALVLAILAQLRWGLAPLRGLRSALADVRSGRCERVGRGFGPDLDPVAEEIDEVLARNAQVVQRARHHAADLSHALKQPLALLAGEAGSGQESVRAGLVRQSVATMSRLIERHLARAGSGAGERRRLALRDPASALVALMQRLHRERGLQWSCDVPAELAWRGEPTDFDDMLGNLLDNAGKWAATQVRVHARAEGGGVVLQVDDDGPGLSDADCLEATRRGRRFDEATEGSGLGLAIVCDLAETYGGRLELARAPLGGLRASLVLPG